MGTFLKDALIGSVIVLLIGGAGWLVRGHFPTFGADGDSNFTNVVAEGDITAGDDLTVTGGCVQLTATSGGPAIKLVLGSSTVSTGTHSNTLTAGFAFWAYGTCT